MQRLSAKIIEIANAYHDCASRHHELAQRS
jgi:hypothetical protein